MKKIILILVLQLCFACTPQESISSNPNLADEKYLTAAFYQRLNNDFINIMKSKKGECDFELGFKNCPKSRVKFLPAQFRDKSFGQRILILDEPFIPLSSFFKNKERVLSFLDFNESENEMGYHEIIPQVEVPLLLQELMNNWQRTYDFEQLDAREMQSFSYPLLKLHHQSKVIFPQRMNAFSGHGEHIFEWLAFYNPHAQFVLGSLPQISKDSFCQMHLEKQRESIIEMYHVAGDSILSYIQKYDISFVNLSWAPSIERINEFLERECPASLEKVKHEHKVAVMQARKYFVDRMAENEEVFIFLALPNSQNKKLYEDDRDDAFHCFKKENVFHIGQVSYFTNRIPANGKEIEESWIPYIQRSVMGCADIFINGGIDEQKASKFYSDNHNFTSEMRNIDIIHRWWKNHSLMYFYFGIHPFPIEAMATSWATPLALSLVNSIKQKRQLLQPSQIEQLLFLTNSLKGKIFDPLRNQTF